VDDGRAHSWFAGYAPYGGTRKIAFAVIVENAGYGARAAAPIAGEKPEDRKKYRDAWDAWWKANGSMIDLAKLTSGPGYLGYTVLVEVGNNSNGRVAEVGRDGHRGGTKKSPHEVLTFPEMHV